MRGRRIVELRQSEKVKVSLARDCGRDRRTVSMPAEKPLRNWVEQMMIRHSPAYMVPSEARTTSSIYSGLSAFTTVSRSRLLAAQSSGSLPAAYEAQQSAAADKDTEGTYQELLG